MTILRSSIVLFAVVAAARGQGNIAFSPSSVATADPVRRVLAADLTGTARPDVIALSAGASSVSVFDLDAAAAATVIPAALPPFFGACADMDGDGDADIVTANGPTPLAGAGTLNLIRRTGGVFQTTPYAIPYAAHVHLRDLDQDGDRDVVVGRTILLNDGAGNLSAGPVPAGAPQILELKPGDFDGDGDVDLFGDFSGTAAAGPGWVGRIYRRNASGTYTLLGAILFHPLATAGRSAAADMNGDGIDDLVVQSGQMLNERIRTHLGGPGFNFSALPALDVRDVDLREDFALADIDGDGLPDFAGAHAWIDDRSTDALALILLNDGTGALVPAPGPLLGSNQAAHYGGTPAAGDLDQDGDVDLVVRSGDPAADPLAFALLTNGTSTTPAGANPGIAITFITPESWSDTAFPVVAAATLPGGGAALGQLVAFQSILPNGTQQAAPYGVVNYAGESRATIAGSPVAGVMTVTASLASGASASSTVTITLPFTILSGDGQSAFAGLPFAVPLRVRFVAPNGQPFVGFPVSWTAGGAAPISLSATSVPTNSTGEASITVQAQSVTGAATVTVGALFVGATVTFQLGVLPNQAEIAGGDAQIGGVGRAFDQPLEVRVLDGNGAPLPGVPVSFAVTLGAAGLSAAAGSTDGAGVASTQATPSLPGELAVAATCPFGVVTFDLFARGLRIVGTPATTIFIHSHEHAGVPLLLMVDAPLAPPGHVSTTFGDVYTSVLAPGPSYGALDGFGLYGPPDPSMVTGTNGAWIRQFVTPPPLGLSLVTQMASYDVAYPFPQVLALSNPVFFNL